MDLQGTFNRDTRSVAVGLLGILVLGVWACIVLTQSRRPPKGSHTEIAGQDRSGSSPAAGSATGFPQTESSADRSSDAVTAVKSPLAEQGPTEPPPKESLGWRQIATGSTPSPVLTLSPEISHRSDRADQSESLLPYQPNSARTFRRKAPAKSPRSARQFADAEAKRRLLELWHRSLAKSQTTKSWDKP